MTDESFGAAVRRRRVEAGLSQDGLAIMAGLSRNTVSNVERGIGVIEDHTKHVIERAFERVASGEQVAEHRPRTHTGPCLLYVATDGIRHAIDAEAWDPGTLSDRERALYDALVAYTLKRLGGVS
jgi:transcriptional regulator with XRE-family HTH domain